MNIAGLKRYMPLLKELIRRDVKIKYRRSFLGFLWSVLNPLGTMVILTIVFSTVFRQSIENFSVYLMCGQLIFNFFNEATSMSMSSIVGNAGLITKVYVPKYFFPISRVCSSFVNLLTSFVALVIVIVVTRTPVSWTVIFAIFPVLYVLLFSIGIGMVLSAVTVSFRDMMHLYGVVVTALMYLTPIFYPMDMLKNADVSYARYAYAIVSANPITKYVQMLRCTVLDQQIPSIQDHLDCLIPCVIALVLGAVVFKKLQDKFILRL